MEALAVVAVLAFLYGIYHAVRAGVRDGIVAARESESTREK